MECVSDRVRGVTEEIVDWKFLSFKPEDGSMREEEDERKARSQSRKDEDDAYEHDEDDEEQDGAGRVKMEDINANG